jgi:hypothetical protein
MIKKLLVLAVSITGVMLWRHMDTAAPSADSGAGVESAAPGDSLAAAIDAQQSGVQVTGVGTVSRILADDNDGSRHQRFILELASGGTLLISHNIDLAPRIEALREGDSVSFNGVYEWNDRGGLVHWTHHDPQGQHEAGWLRHDGRVYE